MATLTPGRGVWSGSISFGLVNIPVGLHSAVKNKQPRFHMLHKKDKARIRQKMVCSVDQKEVSREDLVKGYELNSEQLVVIDPKELNALAPKARRTIDIVDFVDIEEIDSIYFDHPYYLLPKENANKAYQLFLDALKQSNKVGIGTFVMRNQQYLAAIRPLDEVLFLETMFYADEVLSEKDLGKLIRDVKVNPKELKIANELIESMTVPFKPEKYQDEYRKAVMKLVSKKAHGETLVTQPEEEEKAEVIDIMSALEASLKESKRKEKEASGYKEPKRKVKKVA